MTASSTLAALHPLASLLHLGWRTTPMQTLRIPRRIHLRLTAAALATAVTIIGSPLAAQNVVLSGTGLGLATLSGRLPGLSARPGRPTFSFSFVLPQNPVPAFSGSNFFEVNPVERNVTQEGYTALTRWVLCGSMPTGSSLRAPVAEAATAVFLYGGTTVMA